jgi:hypothetical protein
MYLLSLVAYKIVQMLLKEHMSHIVLVLFVVCIKSYHIQDKYREILRSHGLNAGC